MNPDQPRVEIVVNASPVAGGNPQVEIRHYNLPDWFAVLEILHAGCKGVLDMALQQLQAPQNPLLYTPDNNNMPRH